MARRKVSNPLALAVLGCLLERPMHPYEMSTTMRERRKEDSIKLNYGSLYSVVETLTRHGLIAARETLREGRRPERTVYEITDAGRDEFVDWLSELVAQPVREYTQFEAALSMLTGLPPTDVQRLLEKRAGLLADQLAATRAGLAETVEYGLPRLFGIEVEYRQALRAAELDFLRALLDEITDGSLDGLGEWQQFHTEGAIDIEEMFRRRRVKRTGGAGRDD